MKTSHSLGASVLALLAVTAAGALLLPTDTAAVGYSLEIDTPTGSSFLECTGNTLYIGTSLPAGVTLSGVSPNFPDQPLTNSVSNVCRAGFQLTPSQNCQLACPLPNNG